MGLFIDQQKRIAVLEAENRMLHEAALMLIGNAIAFRTSSEKMVDGRDFKRLQDAVNAIKPGPDAEPARHGEGPSGGHATGIYARP